MVDVNKFLPLARKIAMGVVCVLGIVVFAISAHLISLTSGSPYSRGWSSYYAADFAALSLATALLTLLTVPAMFVVSIKRQGAFSSWIAVEVGWFWFLWIMWVASAGSTTAIYWGAYCIGSVCHEVQVLKAFGYLNWLTLMFYTTTLLVLAVMAHIKGHTGVWKSEVARFDWSAPSLKKAGSPADIGGVAAPSAPAVGSYQSDKAPEQQYPPPQGQQAYVGAPANGAPYPPQV